MFKTPTDPVTRAVYQQFLRLFALTGQPPTVEALVTAAMLPDAATANHYLSQMEAVGCLYRNPASGQITSAYPFSAVPTPHRVSLANDSDVYAMCAIDALGMPFMLNLDAIIHSSCQQCGKELTVHIANGTISTALPHDIVVLYATAPEDCCAATDQCPYINFFCGLEDAHTWQARHLDLDSKVMNLAEALDAGRATFGHLLHPIEGTIRP